MSLIRAPADTRQTPQGIRLRQQRELFLHTWTLVSRMPSWYAVLGFAMLNRTVGPHAVISAEPQNNIKDSNIVLAICNLIRCRRIVYCRIADGTCRIHSVRLTSHCIYCVLSTRRRISPTPHIAYDFPLSQKVRYQPQHRRLISEVMMIYDRRFGVEELPFVVPGVSATMNSTFHLNVRLRTGRVTYLSPLDSLLHHRSLP